MQSVAEVGGLAVVFNQASRREIERELARLDPRLFLDPEVETHGPRGAYTYMTVKHHVGSNHPPVLVVEWRDASGPLPLSHGIVERVKRQEGALASAFRDAMAANEQKRQQAIRDVGDQSYEVALDARKATGKTSAVLPRSQALRRSRDRARAKGRNV